MPNSRAIAEMTPRLRFRYGIGHDEADVSTAPTYFDLTCPNDLLDKKGVIRDLKRIDWSFTAEDTSYLSHDLHPYPAKFIPQIPGHLISRLSLRGELVFDPFAGSGTTALESIRLGRRALCVDANRVGMLVGRVKTARLDKAALRDIHAIRSSLLARLEQMPDDPRILLETYGAFVPDIPNRSKWFPDNVCGELALIRASIEQLETASARDVANLAMSRIIVKVSFQDSETRYASRPRKIADGEPLRLFLRALDDVVENVMATASDIRYGVADFIEADSRNLDPGHFPDESVDLVVTSPPYGNANDYHLYHRFRLFWLGADPRLLATMEVGSHLRHQKESTGFDSYRAELRDCFVHIGRMLRSGRYAAVVIGDSLYNGTCHRGSDLIQDVARASQLDTVTVIERPIHRTKRSFVAAGRRATTEALVILRKRERVARVALQPPPYTLWSYERTLRGRESARLSKHGVIGRDDAIMLKVPVSGIPRLRALAFSHTISVDGGRPEPIWQAILENGLAASASARKDPKYVTHGIHPYKGKFYPQLAKALINISGVKPAAHVLDPFCGSGTTLLESYLNGLSAVGCDMNPLAATIARAKVGILELDPGLVLDAVETLREKLAAAPGTVPHEVEQLDSDAQDEIHSWFPRPVVFKINWLLRAIRSVSAATLRDFLEVILSSILREVSQQEPSDLRVRRRKKAIRDADAFGLFKSAVDVQMGRLERFWSVRGYCPYRFCRARADSGDSRHWSQLESVGVRAGTVDLVLTSPPYATALPYIDTDRLSLAVLYGVSSRTRRPLELGLTGSREITQSDRDRFEEALAKCSTELPDGVTEFVSGLHRRVVDSKVGFRRRNMPALLIRFFTDMRQVLINLTRALKPEGDAMVVMGDNYTYVGSEQICIPTTRLLAEIACDVGFRLIESIPITVTTENRMHIRHAIKENSVLWLRRR